jgi:hypothetical protein
MDDLSRFRAMVLEDLSLQRRLIDEGEMDPFVDLVVQLAAERGVDITPVKVRWAIQEARAGASDEWKA